MGILKHKKKALLFFLQFKDSRVNGTGQIIIYYHNLITIVITA